jgi:hypothetical protein
MPTVEVDVVFFITVVILAFVPLPINIGISGYRMWKSKEFWLRIRRQDYVYILMKTPLGRLMEIVVSTKRIGPNNRIRLYGKRNYYLRDQTDDGITSVITWKKGRPGYLLDWRHPYPMGWLGNPGLAGSTVDPATIASVEDQKILEQIMLADFNRGFQLAALALAVISIIVTLSLLGFVFSMNSTVTHVNCVLSANGNATIAAGCH